MFALSGAAPPPAAANWGACRRRRRRRSRSGPRPLLGPASAPKADPRSRLLAGTRTGRRTLDPARTGGGPHTRSLARTRSRTRRRTPDPEPWLGLELGPRPGRGLRPGSRTPDPSLGSGLRPGTPAWTRISALRRPGRGLQLRLQASVRTPHPALPRSGQDPRPRSTRPQSQTSGSALREMRTPGPRSGAHRPRPGPRGPRPRSCAASPRAAWWRRSQASPPPTRAGCGHSRVPLPSQDSGTRGCTRLTPVAC